MLKPILQELQATGGDTQRIARPDQTQRIVAEQPPEHKPLNYEPVVASRELDLAPLSPAANKRRIYYTLQQVAIFLVATTLLFGSLNWWFYTKIKSDSESKLAALEERLTTISLAPTPAPTTPSAIPVTSEKLVSAEDLHQSEEALKAAASETQAQVLGALRRLTEMEAKTKQNTWGIEDLTASTAAVKKDLAALAEKPKALPSPPPVVVPDTGAERAPVTPTQSELVLLKERNRLTELADEAIATGKREPYNRLWEAFDDPRLAPLIHAARAEILRVQNFYLSGSRLQKFDIPVAELFPATPTLKDTQLSDDQVIGLLGDATKDWPIRVKSAWLLGQRRSTRSGEALVKAITEDPNLDVVKEATFSLEQMTGFHAKIFEPKQVEEFWKNFTAKQPPKVEEESKTEPKNQKKEAAKPAAAGKKSSP